VFGRDAFIMLGDEDHEVFGRFQQPVPVVSGQPCRDLVQYGPVMRILLVLTLALPLAFAAPRLGEPGAAPAARPGRRAKARVRRTSARCASLLLR
jgi:hypothetical protein